MHAPGAIGTDELRARALEVTETDEDFLHAWCVPVDVSERLTDELLASLSRDERKRAHRFAHPSHGVFYARCRSLLRTLLGAYLGRPGAELRFRYGTFGKPTLRRPRSALISFNLAHSGDRLLVAVTSAPAVGIDLERIREDVAYDALMRQFFAPLEIAALERLEPPRRRAAFFQCWTRKEAYVKARGEGFAIPLHRFAVSCPPEPAALLGVAGMEDEATRWVFKDLDVGPGFAATLAVEHGPASLHFRRWQPEPPPGISEGSLAS